MNSISKTILVISAFKAQHPILMLVIEILIILWGLVIRWRIFVRAGEKGWKALIPVYGTIVIIRRILHWGKASVAVFLFILVGSLLAPSVYVIYNMALQAYIARRFGKGLLFGAGASFLWIIFGGILAFEKTEQEPQQQTDIPASAPAVPHVAQPYSNQNPGAQMELNPNNPFRQNQ